MRNDTWTGGEHYWIQYSNGTHHVMVEETDDNNVCFTGRYDACVNHINKLLEENADYDLNL